MAYRIPLKGKEGETHVITYASQGEKGQLTVTCEFEARGWPHTYNMPPDAARVGRSFLYAKLGDGAGYMYLRRVDDSAVPDIREAVETYPDAKGWILDLRGNGGGGYDDTLIERVQALPRPVAVLIDAGCMSAGETLARDLARHAEAHLFGSRTAGASSAKRVWTFPSGIASVVIPTRSRWRNDGQPIEFNGIEPDVEVEAVPEEVANGLNSEILRAQGYLAQASAAQPTGSEKAAPPPSAR
jgi:C-terminal processing protease CtpA/Prc